VPRPRATRSGERGDRRLGIGQRRPGRLSGQVTPHESDADHYDDRAKAYCSSPRPPRSPGGVVLAGRPAAATRDQPAGQLSRPGRQQDAQEEVHRRIVRDLHTDGRNEEREPPPPQTPLSIRDRQQCYAYEDEGDLLTVQE